MYQGRLVETGPASKVYGEPVHPYTRLLLDSAPGAKGPGPKEVAELPCGPSGCPFYGRCPERRPRCRESRPHMRTLSGDREAACHFPGI
jgi:oligopeptide/dipeptide ABC transporter ATP-binding protein